MTDLILCDVFMGPRTTMMTQVSSAGRMEPGGKATRLQRTENRDGNACRARAAKSLQQPGSQWGCCVAEFSHCHKVHVVENLSYNVRPRHRTELRKVLGRR